MRTSVNFLIALLAALALAGLAACNKQADQGSAAAQSTPTEVEEAAFLTADIKVEGMHCDNCRQSIEGAVGKMAGVQSVSADFEKGEAIVSFDPSLTSQAAISQEIESLGFTVPKSGGEAAKAGENDNPVTSGDEAETEPTTEGDG